MSAEPLPISSSSNTNLHTSSLLTDSSSLSLWERIGSWASENKAIVYTIAGVAVVVSGAGVIYYLSDTGSADSEKKRPSKKERRKAKQEREKDQTQPTQSPSSVKETSRSATVESDPLEGIPPIDESSVERFSSEVRLENLTPTSSY